KRALASEMFVESNSGYGGFFADRSFFTDEFMQLFVHSWHRTRHAYGGLMAYLCAVDPKIVDTLDEVHARTRVPMLFIWGKGDRVFPLKYAREMVAKIPGDAHLVEIDKAHFLPHEEQPDAVADALLTFLQSTKAAA
ncbi:MAG: alpha/beta fold hydrolase, partial [Candidatus Phaeomarinobacter sp.]